MIPITSPSQVSEYKSDNDSEAESYKYVDNMIAPPTDAPVQVEWLDSTQHLVNIYLGRLQHSVLMEIKVIHKEYSRFLKQFFPTLCLYHELNIIIYTSYINI